MRLESGVFSNWQTVNARGIIELGPTFFDVTVLSQSFQNFSWQRLRYDESDADDVWGSISLNTPWGIPFQVLTSKILQRSLQPFPLYCYTVIQNLQTYALSTVRSIFFLQILKRTWLLKNKIWKHLEIICYKTPRIELNHCAIVIQYVLANPSFLFLCISLLPLKSESNVNVQYELLYTVLNPTFILLLLLTFNPQSRKR